MKKMEDGEISIYEYEGAGYEPTMHFESWRVAIANPCERFSEDKFERLERHRLTDEVFVLLFGQASLVIGKELRYVTMEPGKIYNVKTGTWHNILLGNNAKVLIVENHNTNVENTEYYQFGKRGRHE